MKNTLIKGKLMQAASMRSESTRRSIHRVAPGRRPTFRGFTLIELMIVVLIISILAAVAYPSFMGSVRRNNRTDAHAAMMRMSNNQERFFATNGTYTLDPLALGFELDGADALSQNDHYVLTVAAGPVGIGTSYVITATAVAGDIQADDTGCETYTVDSLGVRTPNPVDSNCW
jgi:type IV pilus assembly protein PilE